MGRRLPIRKAASGSGSVNLIDFARILHGKVDWVLVGELNQENRFGILHEYNVQVSSLPEAAPPVCDVCGSRLAYHPPWHVWLWWKNQGRDGLWSEKRRWGWIR